ncbi:C10 family peptidase [Dyadobacter sp. CY356]|uniref:C10 family peptidase n=1 Tax=Dyadobacter sp. CY356 TaxID=2906442 RepID=UPI001F26EB82|nr:C10 family peptidase [Dyadobacter sp. CY356]MCF0057190.1 C10 family peptidase [Dyadobacter sp. CY356]
MKTTFHLKHLFIITFLLILNGCKNSQDESQIQQDSNLQSNYVSLEQALKIASIQAPLNNQSGNKNGKINKREVQSSFKVNPDGNNPSMYIINYEGGGFTIISADKRAIPVLAYSDDNRFDTETKTLPGGLLGWLAEADGLIQEIRKENKEQSPEFRTLWDKFNQKEMMGLRTSALRTSGYAYADGDCNTSSNYTIFTGANQILSSTWSQGTGWNDACDYAGCSQTYNGRYWTGCVATALGQIMRYHQYPTTFNWSSMPLGYSTSTTASFLKELGNSNKLNMSYGCDGSSSNTGNIPAVLTSYGYASGGSYQDFNRSTVESELYAGYPVILAGGRNAGWWIFGNYADGHAWVGDGYSNSLYYWCQPDPNTPGEQIDVFSGIATNAIHMNWGGGGNNDGWYAENNWKPGSSDYTYKRKMVTGIRRP